MSVYILENTKKKVLDAGFEAAFDCEPERYSLRQVVLKLVGIIQTISVVVCLPEQLILKRLQLLK